MSPIFSLLLAFATLAPPPHASPARNKWDFKFKDFVIGAWWGPSATDAEMKLYKDAGFNVVMGGRYMQLDHYGNPDEGVQELDLAEKYGLGLLFDTYTKNDHPWGGLKDSGYDSHPTHHAASLAELEWLYKRLGKHPALVGFMIGDDQGSVTPRTAACTDFLHSLPKPHLFPWLCGWIAPSNLAQHGNPICDPQIYPTLYSWGQSADEHARSYAATYWSMSRQCREQGVMFWPMFNAGSPEPDGDPKSIGGALPSDSLMRFPAYAAVAYGAEGIFYFCYSGGNISKVGPWNTEQAARAALTKQYDVVSRINHRIALWGPSVIGRTSTGLFGTAFSVTAKGAWPFEETLPSAEGLASPGQGKLIEQMGDRLLAGVLIRADKPPLVMVVNCQTSKGFGDEEDRVASIRFAPEVESVKVIDKDSSITALGNQISLPLEPGGGQLLELDGSGLEKLCATKAIYETPRQGEEPSRALSAADLERVRAAKLRIDVYGSKGGKWADKVIELNGHKLAQVPVNDADRWDLCVVDVPADQLTFLGKRNDVVVVTHSGDAWKFANVTLAVQLADGTWVKSTTDPLIHSAPGWAAGEGRTWGKDGVAGSIRLSFR